ncbi:MAG: peptidoglycan-binding protein [Candidatus Ventricola sp.]|nr:peptidoglycan-binding protein [Candidatus Ventricola sp.]
MKRIYLATMLAAMLFLLSGCFIQPDPTLDPLVIHEGVVPFGTVQPLPTNTPTPVAENQPTPTPDAWQSSDQSTWEDWAQGSLPTSTPRTAATAAPGAQSWATSTEDYNAGYPVLMMGSTGTDVSDLQARLTELGYYTGAIDGRYASGTQTAVQEFQERNGLTADGIAGRQTQDLLYSGSAQPKYVTVSASGDAEEYLLLKQGTSGVEVRKLQGRLAELGYYAGGVDGIYGETTASAVKAFQRANGLSGDGQAGVQTQSKLYSSSARYASSPVATANPDATRTLTLGMTGNDVYALQERLIELRYLTGVADGVFGAETQAALIAFQKNNGLTADGNAGSSTLKKLAGSCKAATRTTPTPVPSGTVTLREGDEGENVYILQAYLFELGYYTGRIDGRFSAETTEAVKAFQRANGLTADGIAGKGTQSKLTSGSAIPAGNANENGQESGTPPQTSELTTLRRGDKSAQVMVMQQYLMELGYLSTQPDGQFGAGTERAVKLFQEANGLTADGVAGKGTLSILYSGSAVAYGGSSGGSSSSGSSPAATATPRPNTDIVIQWESEGDDVRQYQQRLVELGYLSSKYVTGKFNQPTVEATKAFQTMNGLKVDGAAGPQSLKLIYSNDALNADGVRVGDLLMSSSGTGVSEVLTAGMTGEQVRQVQSRLAELGYLSASFVNGVYDDNTRQAIRRFQQANGLTADGAAGSATQSRLYASGAVTAQTARMAGDNTGRQTQEYRVNGAYQLSVGGGGIAVGDRSALYCADASQGGALVKQPYDGSAATVLAYETPRFLHLTNGRLYYVASSGGEDCVIRMNADGTSHEVLDRAGVILRFALHDGVMYVLDANGALKERTLSGEESELMEGVADFCLDVQGNALLCVTQEGVVSFGIDTGRTTTLYAGSADQAVLCADILLVRSGGSILRVANGQTATIRRDGAKLMGVYGQKVISLTGKGVMTCDVNGENATMILYGAYETMSAANGVLYVGDGKGVAQQVTL